VFLTRIGVTAFVVLLLMTAGMILYGRQQPESVFTADLHQCGNRVCMLDVVLLRTPYEDAKKSLLANPNFEQLAASASQLFKTAEPYYTVQLYRAESTSVIIELDLFFPQSSDFAVNALVAKFGSPCAVLPRYSAGTAVLIYPGMVIFAANDSATAPSRFAPTSLVRQINLLDNRVQACADMRFDGSITRWRGFRRY
jgi:hypothetical protein